MTSGFAYLGPPGEESEEDLINKLFLDCGPTIAVDTETVSLKDRRLIGIGLSPNPQEAYYFQVLPEPSIYLDAVWELLESDRLKVFHNAMYDLGVLGESYTPVADTSIMMQMQALPLKLKDAVHCYLEKEIDEIGDVLPKRKNMLDLDFPTVAGKCLNDTLYTHRLFEQMGGTKWQDKANGHTWTYTPNYWGGYDILEPTSYYVSPQMKDCYDVDIRLIPMLLRMGERGLGLRQDLVREWYKRLSQERLAYQDICTQFGFSPGSNQQVGFALAERGTVLPFTQTRGRNAYKQLKVDEDILSQCEDPLAQVVLQYRKRDKLLGTYIKPWLDQERAYTRFGLETGTGRLRSYDRNIQNVPKPIREIFEPDSGTWTWFDYSQLEMRVFAYLSQDPMMLEAYRLGSDIHTMTQVALWPESDLGDEIVRVRAKGFNFTMIFLGREFTLSKNSGLPVAACKRYREEWLDYYEVAADYMLRQSEEGPAQGWTTTDYGRKQRLPDPSIYPQAHIVKCAINYPTQGTAADIVKRAMLECEEMDIPAQVHDEVLADGEEDFPEGLDHIHPEIYTPFKVTTGEKWG